MRIFSALTLSTSVIRKTGYWLSRRQSVSISRKLQKVLELSEHQRIICVEYLQGCSEASDQLDACFAPSDAQTIQGFIGWYNSEYSGNRASLVVYSVHNLNKGMGIVFTHGGYKNRGDLLPQSRVLGE